MIKPGDKIAVGVSAGKDSLTLLCAMAELRRFYPVPFNKLQSAFLKVFVNRADCYDDVSELTATT